MKKLVIGVIGCVGVITAFAKPAPWYLWSSELTELTICKQTSPGKGWEKADGPFQDARCFARQEEKNQK